jgi:hypothetical protein
MHGTLVPVYPLHNPGTRPHKESRDHRSSVRPPGRTAACGLPRLDRRLWGWRGPCGRPEDAVSPAVLNDRARKNQGAPEKQDSGCDPGERRGAFLPDCPDHQAYAPAKKDDRGGVPQAQNQSGPGSAPVGRRILGVWHGSQLPDVLGPKLPETRAQQLPRGRELRLRPQPACKSYRCSCPPRCIHPGGRRY